MTTSLSSSEADRTDRQVAQRSTSAPIPVQTTIGWINYLLAYFHPSPPTRLQLLLLKLAPLGAFVVGAGSGIIDPKIGVAMVGLVAVIAITWTHPPMAAYIMLALAPLIVGLDRDQVIPILRPNEALLIVLVGVLSLHWLYESRRIVVKPNGVDLTMIGLVFTGFLLPLLTQTIRLRPLGFDDVLYALVFVKLGLLYGVFRYTIRRPEHVRAAIGFSLATASFLGLLGLADSLNVLDMAERLNPYFPNAGPQADDGRGAATIGNPIGFGVYQGINAALALAMLLGGERPRVPLAAAALCCSIGVFGSGQIGPALSFIVGLGVLALVTKSVLQLVRWSLPFVLLCAILITPLISQRVDGFGGAEVTGATRQSIAEAGGQDESVLLFEANPGSSWEVRLYNLETYFIPEFDDAANVMWGVTPQARVPSPLEGEDFIWIESGHLWLLWSGGVPLFVAFFAFIAVGAFTGRRLANSHPGPVGIVGAAVVAGLAMLFVAQTFDPHITLRGTADVLYPLAALMAVGRTSRSWQPPDTPATSTSSQQRFDSRHHSVPLIERTVG